MGFIFRSIWAVTKLSVGAGVLAAGIEAQSGLKSVKLVLAS